MQAPLVNLAEIAKVQFFILKRMKELAMGDHASVFKGSGFDFAGLREWEPGDAISSVDWAHSSLNNFSPLVTREFEQDSIATIVAVADASTSTRCGAQGTHIMSAIARCVAAIGLSSVLFQDQFGLITFDSHFRLIDAARPRIGKGHVTHCLDLYERALRASTSAASGPVTAAIAGHLRKTALVPVISDFLFEDAERVIGELALLNSAHDLFLLMVDARFAFKLPNISAGWVEAYDVESGRMRVLSRREMSRLAERVGEWQEQMIRLAREHGLDMVRVGLDRWAM